MTKTPISIDLAKSGQLASVLTYIDYPKFTDDVACFEEDTEMFFSKLPAQIAKAKSLCAQCPMIKQCAAWAVPNEEYGVFGGLSAKERQLIRGGQPALDTQGVAYLRDEVTFIFTASAKQVAVRFGVQTRTVVRWRNILRPLKEVA